jgi:hypothetical protein
VIYFALWFLTFAKEITFPFDSTILLRDPMTNPHPSPTPVPSSMGVANMGQTAPSHARHVGREFSWGQHGFGHIDSWQHNWIPLSTLGSSLGKKFKGQIEELENCPLGPAVYDYVTLAQAAKVFRHTIEEIARYITKHYVGGVDVAWAIEDWASPDIPQMVDLSSTQQQSESLQEDMGKQIGHYVSQTAKREENMAAAYGVIWGQCSKSVQTKLKSMTALQAISTNCNMLRLLTSIESLMFSFEFEQNMTLALVEADKQLKSMWQDAGWVLRSILSTSKLWSAWPSTLVVMLDSKLEVLKRAQAREPEAIELVKDSSGRLQQIMTKFQSAAREEVHDEYLAILFLLNADRQQYGLPNL